MKKYIIFATAFILLFVLFQVLSGLVLTYVYTPDIEAAWVKSAGAPQETVIRSSGGPYLLTFLMAFAAATVAYFIVPKSDRH
ncbi:hypothetical protein SAMN05216238_103127 [Lentibacillus persicus]|uniref:Menaquinol-cytochrome c reductase cytochrome b subunit n=1 Tax=Lentibacillus persicus TaxID=640948 RepID=A0A1I1UH52_9BACI|nr:hypothetical protein [Lentibacillus persicus]SFD68083.1 hypothetical protein SAMN05216238_103127 [Lentibacillus persicus]